jgi:uncharacterized membrane protein YfcA
VIISVCLNWLDNRTLDRDDVLEILIGASMGAVAGGLESEIVQTAALAFLTGAAPNG